MTTDIVLIDEKTIKDKMYYIRGQKVMLDSDLAKIYGYTTKRFNEQVQRNIEKFDNDFMFRLTNKEMLELSRSHFATSIQTKGIKGGRVYNPYVFTEQGIYMLMTVLKGELAIKQSKSLIRVFKKMKDYLSNNHLIEINSINNILINHENKINYIDNEIKLLQETFDKLEEKEKVKVNTIFFEGQIYDAYSLLLKILNKSKEEIILIDNYAGKELLDILKSINKKIIIISSNIDDILIKKYSNQYNNVIFKNNKSFHDRFIIIDRKELYSCGASFKDIGNKCFALNKIEDKEYLKIILNNICKEV